MRAVQVRLKMVVCQEESSMQMPVKSQAAAHVSEQPTRELSEFLASIRYEQLPQTVVDRTEDLFLDWLASALAGRDARPVAAMEHFASMMGPAEGASEILTTRRKSSPFFAALVNAAASHYVEQDDLHNSSVLHPGTVVFRRCLRRDSTPAFQGKRSSRQLSQL
jgi:hypothetical protein